MSPSPPAVPPASPAAVEIERALTHVAYLSVRARQHDRLVSVAGVPLDRAAVAMLRQIAEHEPLRPGELARALAVQASHVTRQVQRLQRAGYVTRVADPDDHRARRIRLTPLGESAVARLGDAAARGMQLALANWSPCELRRLAGLFQRMVETFQTEPAALDGAAGVDDPTGPPRPAGSAECGDRTDEMDQVERTDQPDQPDQPDRPVQARPAGPVGQTSPAQSAQSANSANSAEATDVGRRSIRPAQPAHSTRPAQPAQPAQPAPPTQAACSTPSTQPTHPAEEGHPYDAGVTTPAA